MSSPKRYKWEFRYGLSSARIAVLRTRKELPVYAYNPSNAGTVLPYTINKLIALLHLLLQYGSRQYACDLLSK